MALKDCESEILLKISPNTFDKYCEGDDKILQNIEKE